MKSSFHTSMMGLTKVAPRPFNSAGCSSITGSDFFGSSVGTDFPQPRIAIVLPAAMRVVKAIRRERMAGSGKKRSVFRQRRKWPRGEQHRRHEGWMKLKPFTPHFVRDADRD